MGIANVSMKDGMVDVYVDYVPVIKEMNLLEDKKIMAVNLYASQLEVLKASLEVEDLPSTLDVYIDEIIIPYLLSSQEDVLMDLGIKFTVDLVVKKLQIIVSYGETQYLGNKRRKYIVVETKFKDQKKWRRVAEFHGTDNYPNDKGIACPMRKPDEKSKYYSSEDYKKRQIHPALREFIRSPLEEKDYIGGGEESLLFYTHLSNLEEIIKFAVIRTFL